MPSEPVGRIVEVLRPLQVWLFGSRARGEERVDSDWDFMAILPDGAPEQDLDTASVWGWLRDLRLRRVEVFTMTREEFETWRHSLGTLQPAWSSMASEAPHPDLRVITAYLDDLGLELDAARRLVADPPNRLAAFHLQQAAEKLIKAVRLGRGLRVTAERNLEILIEDLAEDDPWHSKLASPASIGCRLELPGKARHLTAGHGP